MFTGIIEKQGEILQVESHGSSLQIHVKTDFTGIQLGDSIAVNGVCLTVTDFSPSGDLSFFLSPETLEKTGLNSVQKGTCLNLERALTLQTRLSGHFLQGHVDGTADFLGAQFQSGCHSLRFQLPRELARYCVPKGSIGLNGISLTINSVLDQPDQSAIVQVMIIPHTWTHTNLSQLKPHQKVNIEIDILAKYVERLCQC